MAPVRFEKCVDIPEINYRQGEGIDDKKLSPELAKASLEYLRKYEYASVDHVSMGLMCHSGPQKSGLRGLDADDFNYDESVLKYTQRETTRQSTLIRCQSAHRAFRRIQSVGDTLPDSSRPVSLSRLSATDVTSRR